MGLGLGLGIGLGLGLGLGFGLGLGLVAATLDRPLAAVHDRHEGAVRLQRHLGRVSVRVS